MRIRKPRKAFAEKRIKFKEMAEAGVKYTEIERVLDIAHPTAMLWRREFDIPLRPRLGRPHVDHGPRCRECKAWMRRVAGTNNLWECECTEAKAATANG
jgi:hypothetical protein